MPDYPRKRFPQQHLPLTVPVFQILLSLTDRAMHGYAIIQDIAERTEREVELTASTLYAAVQRLLEGGLIEETSNRPDPARDDPRRRYYAITSLGMEVARLETARLDRMLKTARRKGLTPRRA